jgi:hypothetical protein
MENGMEGWEMRSLIPYVGRVRVQDEMERMYDKHEEHDRIHVRTATTPLCTNIDIDTGTLGGV